MRNLSPIRVEVPWRGVGICAGGPVRGELSGTMPGSGC